MSCPNHQWGTRGRQVLPAYAGMIPDKLKTADDGKWNRTEICAANKVVGFIVRKDGTEVPTRLFKIHYSKTGTHIVPYAKDGKPWNGKS